MRFYASLKLYPGELHQDTKNNLYAYPPHPPQNQSTPPPEVPSKAITEAFLHQSHAWNFSVLLNKSVCVCVTVFRATDKLSLSLGMNVKENVCKILV